MSDETPKSPREEDHPGGENAALGQGAESEREAEREAGDECEAESQQANEPEQTETETTPEAEPAAEVDPVPEPAAELDSDLTQTLDVAEINRRIQERADLTLNRAGNAPESDADSARAEDFDSVENFDGVEHFDSTEAPSDSAPTEQTSFDPLISEGVSEQPGYGQLSERPAYGQHAYGQPAPNEAAPTQAFAPQSAPNPAGFGYGGQFGWEPAAASGNIPSQPYEYQQPGQTQQGAYVRSYDSRNNTFEEQLYGPGGFPGGRGSAPTAQQSRRWPMYFLAFSIVILLVAVAAVFFTQFFHNGRNAAAGGNSGDAPATTAPAGQPSEAPSPSASADGSDLDQLRATVRRLPGKSTCDASSDANTLLAYATAADSAGALSREISGIETALTELSSSCNAQYTVDMTEALTGGNAPAEVTSLASSRDWWHLKRPAGAGAIDVTEFTTPANNIRCRFGEDNVSCSIYAYDYPSPPGCEGHTATYHVEHAGEVTADCDSELSVANQVDYDQVVSHNNFACSASQYGGVTCWSELSGHGFTLKRSAEDRF